MKKLFLILIGLMSMANMLIAQNKTALVIIDVQEFYFPGGAVELHNADKTAEIASEVLKAFRDRGEMIIHVKHEAKAGSDIHHLLTPKESELVITKNEVNAFKGTKLKHLLDKNAVTDLVIIGMQTHMCLEAACRAAADFGFKVTVVDEACTTRDLKYGSTNIEAEAVHASTLATLKSYAHVISYEVFIEKFLN
ncbi:MAG: cysteine hydrolase [Carboxylicivirga sp.]|jgi:nicotinamidase-related amidase|nr:cysteine hydrolase [Carboxylicivirga sp.]